MCRCHPPITVHGDEMMSTPDKSSSDKPKNGHVNGFTVSVPRQPSNQSIPAPARVSIEVLMQPAQNGLSSVTSPEKISFSNVEKFRPHKATQDQAAAQLTEL